MAKHTLDACEILYDKYRLTEDHFRLSLISRRRENEYRPLGLSGVCRLPSVHDTEFRHGGWYEAGSGEVDTVLATDEQSSTGGKVLLVAPLGLTSGYVGLFTRMREMGYTPIDGGEVGGMAAFAGNGKGDSGSPLVYGTLLGVGAKTETGNGTGYQLGAVGATQKLYAALQVYTVSGSDLSLDVIIQSAPASNFASPTTRVTFSNLAAAGSEWATAVAGAITDTYWRAVWTISGTEPSFTIAVVAGIQ